MAATSSRRLLPAEVVAPRGPVYVLVLGAQGMCFRSWAEAESFRDSMTGLRSGEVRVEKFGSMAEAESWMASQQIAQATAAAFHTSVREHCPSPFGDRCAVWPLRGLGQSGGRHRPSGSFRESSPCPFGASSFGTGASASFQAAKTSSAAPSVVTRISLTPAETARARRAPAADGAAAVVRSNVGREALLRALDVPDRDRVLQNAELRVPDGAKAWPSFGFQMTLPGNVIFAEAHNLTVTSPSLRSASTPRGRLVAIYLEALNTDLGSVAVALRVNTMSIYNALRKHIAQWRERGGKDSKKQPVPDFELLAALDTVIRERGLALRVLETAVAQTEWSRGVRGAAGAGAGSGSSGAGSGSSGAATTA
jgi:hypothetical protein